MQTLTALYGTVDDAESTVRALEAAGISRDSVGLLMANPAMPAPEIDEAASGAKTGATLGAVFGGGAGLLVGLGSVVIPGFGPVVAIGWWATAALGLVGGAASGGVAGGLVGKLVELGLSEEDAKRRVEDVGQGAILLSVQVDGPKEAAVEALLSKYHPLDRRRSEAQAADR
jgi:hypothetical protein